MFFRLLIIAIALCAGFYASTHAGELTFLCMLLSVAGAGLLLCLLVRRDWAAWLGVGVLSLALGGAVLEWFFCKQDAAWLDGRVEEGGIKTRPDDAMGFVPVGDQPFPTRVTLKGSEVYNVTYTFRDGRRVTPEHPRARKAVFFFGCSFTAGHGVQDGEVFPWLVGELLGKDWQVRNYALSGYGPHQFLAQLESGRLDTALTGRDGAVWEELDVFFLLIKWHELRVAGYSYWDPHGPLYVRAGDTVERRGNFDAPQGMSLGERVAWEVAWRFRRSYLGRKLFAQTWRVNGEELQFVQRAVLCRAQELLRQKNPRARFTLLLWPTVGDRAAFYAQAGLRTLDLTPALPQWPDETPYTIPNEVHPSAHAHALVARYLVDWLQRGGPAGTSAGTSGP